MSAVTVQEVIDFSMKQSQAQALQAFLAMRVEETEDSLKWIDATPILEDMLTRYAPG
jgi:hypothetical protein